MPDGHPDYPCHTPRDRDRRTRHHGTIEFTRVADASEWRMSVASREGAAANTGGTPNVATAVG
jgi:hypothetical protein